MLYWIVDRRSVVPAEKADSARAAELMGENRAYIERKTSRRLVAKNGSLVCIRAESDDVVADVLKLQISVKGIYDPAAIATARLAEERAKFAAHIAEIDSRANRKKD